MSREHSDISMNAIKRAVFATVVVCLLAACGKDTNQGQVMKTNSALLEVEKFLTEFKNRKQYTELTPEILQTIPDDKLCQAILDYVAAAIKKDWENDTTKVPQLGAGFSAVYFVSQLDVEVNNGGFNQFFFNDGQRAVELSKEGAEFMGMKELAGIVGKALAIAEREHAKMAKVKAKGTIEAFMESDEDISFDEADDAFSKLDRDLDKEMVAFVRSRPEFVCGKVGGMTRR
jgi:hypothetical protein